MRLLILVTMCLAASFPPGVRADNIDDLVRSEMARHQIPGLALTIRSGAEERKSTVYGMANLELQSPVRSETVFEIGSLTKQFTAACVLLLAQEGRLSVDDAITKHLKAAPPAWSNITIRHLLTHTSGLKNYTGHSGFELTRRLSQAQFIAALSALPPDFAPGAEAKYSNSGYNLLGYIIENVSGKTYWSCLGEKIWQPLGMSSANNRDPIILIAGRADGYVWNGGMFRNRDSDLTDVFSAGAIVCNIRDLSKWAAALETESPLTTALKTQMWTPGTLNDGSKCQYGLGWRIADFEGRRNIGHSGSTSGFSASLQRFPDDKLTVIVLCNSDETNLATTLARQIAKLCFTAPQTRASK